MDELVKRSSEERHPYHGDNRIITSHFDEVKSSMDIAGYFNTQFIPKQYILKRWSISARSGVVIDNSGQTIYEDLKLDISIRSRDLCRNVMAVATKDAESEYTLTLFSKKIVELGVEINAALNKIVNDIDINVAGNINVASNNNVNETNIIDVENVNLINAKGFKKKLGVCPTKGRLKSCLEKKKRNKKS
ncbi:hypothetical protein ACFE04_006855 [Oxalis oulophora]